jgi:hypothetical protein
MYVLSHAALDGPARCDGGRQALAGPERGQAAATRYLSVALLGNLDDLPPNRTTHAESESMICDHTQASRSYSR